MPTQEYRIAELERLWRRLEDQDVAGGLRVLAEKIENNRRAVDDLQGDVTWIKRTVTGAIVTLFVGILLALFGLVLQVAIG
jgi:hypothetical protein